MNGKISVIIKIKTITFFLILIYNVYKILILLERLYHSMVLFKAIKINIVKLVNLDILIDISTLRQTKINKTKQS